MKKVLLSVLVVIVLLSLAACLIPPDENAGLGPKESNPAESSQSPPKDITALSTYALDPSKTDQENLVNGNNAFALNLYQTLVTDSKSKEQNLFYSPYSISMALAMSYAGTRNITEQQMAQTMNFILPQDRLHVAFNSLNTEISSRSSGAEGTHDKDVRLRMANAIWGQEGYGFLPDFTNLLAANYDAGMKTVDFKGAPEDSRITINKWVSDQTEDRIKDLIPPKTIDEYTRLVLTNAIYFNAPWMFEFIQHPTENGYFYLLGGGIVTVPMMKQTMFYGYTEGDNYQAVELLYRGQQFSMVILLPRGIGYEAFEKSLDSKQLDIIVNSLKRTNVTLTMPKFKFESGFKLNNTLSAMGMPVAFIPRPIDEQPGTCSKEWADFSGMEGKCDLYITFVFHKAFVAVDEKGTEAAAATSAGYGIPTAVPPPPVEITIDHPFIFLIRDIETGTILFLGRVMDPS